MYVCRLFHRDQPAEQIDVRLIAEGSMTIGRDPGADWPLADPDGLLSRIHCTLAVEDGALVLRDRSTNGTFLDEQRLARDAAVPIDYGQSVTLGPLKLRVDRMPAASEPVAIPHPTAAPVAAHRDESLVEAFCEGAGIDASGLSGEDPVELMRRVGEIYRQTVGSLSDLIGARGRIKGEHQLDRTTIGAVDNNPFKWMAARRITQDLLCGRAQGYLAGADAVAASFADIACHLDGVAAGAEAAVAAVMTELAPEEIEKEADGRGFELRSRAAACWAILLRRHAALSRATAADAFRNGYARAARTRAPGDATRIESAVR